MSKLLNTPAEIVAEYLIGLSSTDSSVEVDHQSRVVFRSTPATPGKVGLISGGGSGHEPLHTGFVGPGMLDAACVGEVFSAPTPSQIGAAIKRCDTGAGVLLIVKNYMGDQLNFEIAADRAAAEGIEIASLSVDDDVAGSARSDGRRGVGLTVLLEKILGAAAEEGWGLTELHDLGLRLLDRGRSMGIGVSSCIHPVAGTPTFEIGDDEVEIGIGIHGEPGWRRSSVGTAKEMASLIVESILADLQPPEGSRFIGLVNGMGGTPLVELYVMAGEVNTLLTDRGYTVDRYLVGSYITSLEMAGCSLTLLTSDDQLLSHWDAPVRTSAITWGSAA